MFYFYPRTKPNKKRTYGPKTQNANRENATMHAATNAAILDAVMRASAAEGLKPAVVNIDLADGLPAITGISFCHDQFVFFELGEVCGNGPPAAKRARVEELVRALASEARDTPTQSVTQEEPQLDQVGEGPVDDAALLCDETLDDDADEETVGDEAGYESPEPTPMSARERERILCAPEKQRP